MKNEKNVMKKIYCIVIVFFLVITSFFELVSMANDYGNGPNGFILPSWGGGMIHCDPQLTDNIRLPVPESNATINVGELWYRHDFGGELRGTYGNGIAGNNRIAAYGNRLWSSGWWFIRNLTHNGWEEHPWSLNPSACGSVPMIDIHDRVIACDCQKIILVNASDHNNIHVDWVSSFPGGGSPKITPLSPTIVENKTIIVPTTGGPLYAFNVTNGHLLATLSFWDNSSNVSFDAVREMNWSDFFTILSHPLDCPYHYDNINHVILWNSTVQYGIMPMDPVFFEGNVMFKTDSSGVVAAIDMTNGSILAINSLGTPETKTGGKQYATINSACVKGNRVYITTQFPPPNLLGRFRGNISGRLYAIDVNPDAVPPTDILKEAWNYSFIGQSQASPTLINNTIYFDGFNGNYTTLNGSNRNPHIYAVYTNGTLRWKVNYSNITGFSFSMDPRGGFWYNDIGDPLHGGGGRKLVHFNENGNIIENISLQTLLDSALRVWPMSCMVICGNLTHPIMLISANYNQYLPFTSSWVVAINLSDDNSLLWKVQMDNIKSITHLNYPSGLYTILTENNESRVLFGTFLGGVMAIGRFPNCKFENVSHIPWDSSNDYNKFNDSVNVSYTIKTSVRQDYIMVRTMLISQERPILGYYTTDKYYTITPSGIQDNIRVTLPKRAPEGNYTLHVLLHNSTDSIYANDSYNTEKFYLYPPNDPPETPHQPWGNTTIVNKGTFPYTTNTTDPNGDDIWYQWRWNTSLGIDYYTRWIAGGPYASGENCTREIGWLFPGTYKISVRAKDIFFNPNVMSNWSDPLTVTVSSTGGASSWNNNLLGQFSSTMVAINQQTSCNGFADGIEANMHNEGRGSSLNWTWSFGDGTTSYNQNIEHSYNQLGTYEVNLTLKNGEGGIYNCTTNISVVVLRPDFITSGSAQPNKTVYFHDLSKGSYGIVNWSWNFGDGNTSYAQNTSHIFNTTGQYNVSLTTKDSQNNICTYHKIIYVEAVPPEFIDVIGTPNPVPFGYNITINADFFDNQSNVKSVQVNITAPDNTSQNFTMETNDSSPYDYTYTFNDTWQTGVYNYSIWVVDNANNTNCTSGFNFTVIPTPIIDFNTPPTPANQTITNHNWVLVNTTVLDTRTTSAWIDWNRSLKGYWPMDFYNTTGAFDNSTYNNFGKFEGGMTTGNIHTGKYGKAVEFDGTNDDLDLGANNSLHLGTGNFTFIVWENSDQTSYTHKAIILTNRPADASAKGYIFGLQNTAYLYVSQASGNNVTLNGHTDVTDHTWHQIAYVRRGTNYSIFVDSSYDAGITGAMKNITNTQHTYLAYGHWSNNSYFDGLLDEPQLYNRALSREEINASYNNGLHRLTNNFTGLSDGTFQYNAYVIDATGNQSTTETRQITIDTTPPSITTVSATPNTVGFGYNVTINTNVTDSISGVKNVSITITYPTGAGQNPVTANMSHIAGTMYRYIFSNTWYAGRYNYTIIAYDNVSNMRTSAGHSFNVTVSAMISISTLKNSYGGSQYINITDPPNPPQNLTLVGRGLTWNTYYNDSSGCNVLESYQGPVNYQEDNESWTPINTTLFALPSNHPAYNYGYRTGNNHGLFGVYFKPDISSNWPVAFSYNRSNDPTIFVVRSKLVGVGYVDPQSNWAYHYLQSVQSSQGQINGGTVTYPGAFTGTDVSWSYGNMELKEKITMSNATKTVLQNHPPSQYGLNDASSYLVFITKLEYQNLNFYNGSGILLGNVTISDTGIDLKDALGCFKCGLPLGDAWELSNESVRQKLVYRIVHVNGETYLFSGLKVSALSAMIFPVVVDPTLTVYSTSSDGYISNSGNNYNTVRTATTGTLDSSGTFISIGQKMVSGPTYSIYRGFVFFNTSTLPSNAYLDTATLSLYKKDDFSTTDFDITIQNGQPTYPHDAMQSGDYNKNYYVGNGGTLNTAQFSSGYNEIKMTSLNWIAKGGTTKLCLRSSRDINGNAPTGNEYVNVYSNEFLGMCQPKLVVVYRNQSKIKDTGSTNIKGYLLIQVQYYNTQQGIWIVDKDTINETSPRTINSGSQLALDTIFNGHVRASDLTHGAGTYRVYTAFRDSNGNILKTSSGVWLNAWWQFTKT
jgi:PKD repeat protein